MYFPKGTIHCVFTEAAHAGGHASTPQQPKPCDGTPTHPPHGAASIRTRGSGPAYHVHAPNRPATGSGYLRLDWRSVHHACVNVRRPTTAEVPSTKTRSVILFDAPVWVIVRCHYRRYFSGSILSWEVCLEASPFCCSELMGFVTRLMSFICTLPAKV